MTVLAMDVGTKRIGMAISDPLNVIALALPTLERTDNQAYVDGIEKVVKERNVKLIVLGLPIHMNGRIGEEARAIKDFGSLLNCKFGLPIEFVDERWTTKEAEKSMLEGDLSRKKRKSRIDQISAQIILQKYLGMRKTKHEI